MRRTKLNIDPLNEGFDKNLSIETFGKKSTQHFTTKFRKPICVPKLYEKLFLVSANNKLRIFFAAFNLTKYLGLIEEAENSPLYRYAKWLRKSIEAGDKIIDWEEIIVNQRTENSSENEQALEEYKARLRYFEKSIIERKVSRLKHSIISYGCFSGNISIYSIKDKRFAKEIEYYGEGSQSGSRYITFEYKGKFIFEVATRVVVE